MMRNSSEETEIARLREEVRRLHGLLTESEATEQVLSTTERRVAEQTRELANTREELELQARLFHTVLSSIVDFAYIIDREARFTYINQALLDLWQIKSEDAIGRNFVELGYPAELAARLQQQIETVFHTGQTLKDETAYTSAAGATGHYEYIFVPVFDKAGQVELVLNELVSNALKHGKQQADVVFNVKGQSATLTACDDGGGVVENFDPLKFANTGLELVDSLVRTDLRGTVNYGNQPQGGGQVTVTFPLPKQKA